jgi:arginase family enzyme
VAEEDVLLAGIRDVQPAEEERLGASHVTVVEAARIGREGLPALATALDGLRPRSGRVYLHLDLDVLDPAKAGRANEFAPKGGLGLDELLAAIRMVRGCFEVAACGLASYDPSLDGNGRVLRAALACVGELASPKPLL